jgi:hypothetical protein
LWRLGDHLDVRTGASLVRYLEVLLPNQFSQFGIHTIQGVCIGPEGQVFEAPPGNEAGKENGLTE